MVFDSIFDTVALNEINSADHRFKISTSDSIDALVDAIACVGIITPPIVFKQNSTYVVISGFKRITACRQLRYQKIPVQILGPDTPLDHCVKIAIVENTVLRTLNVVEQSRIIELLKPLYPIQEDLCKEASRLGLPINPEMAEKLNVVSKMNPVLQKALRKNHLALSVALQLNKMVDTAAATKIAIIFGHLGLSLNKQREFVDGAIGISYRESISLDQLLEDEKLNQILKNPDVDKKQKSFQVRQYIRKRRFPEISETEKKFHTFIKSLRLGNGIKFIAPPYFESPTYAIKIDFKNQKELISRYHRLQGLLDSSLLKSFWETFGSE